MKKELENQILKFYNYSWPLWKYLGQVNETYGMHVGFYEKGIRGFKKASINMDNYVDRLLELKKETSMNILDAGCGVGGTLLHLAKNYPNANFIGITIVTEQVDLARKYSINNKIENVKFILDDFNKTNFADNSFDRIFALESMAHSYNVEEFVKEMYRILKPSGRLVIVNVFANENHLKYFMKKIYQSSLNLQATPGVISVKDFESYLKNNGFSNIKINDISKNINNGFLKWLIFSMPFFVYFIIAKSLKFEKYKKFYGINYFSNHIVTGSIVGLLNIMTYYSITADKKF